MRWTTGVLMGVTVLTLAAGCGTAQDSPEAKTPGGAPPAAPAAGASGAADTAQSPVPRSANVKEALDVVLKEFELINAGDWAEARNLWTAKAKKEVSEKVWVATNKACPALAKSKYELERVTPVDDTTVEVGWRRDGISENGASRLVDEKWRFDPGPTLSEYADGTEAAVKKRKDGGTCGKS
jgi:hypothetical protein